MTLGIESSYNMVISKTLAGPVFIGTRSMQYGIVASNYLSPEEHKETQSRPPANALCNAEAILG